MISIGEIRGDLDRLEIELDLLRRSIEAYRRAKETGAAVRRVGYARCCPGEPKKDFAGWFLEVVGEEVPSLL